jgi:hypothetical protein
MGFPQGETELLSLHQEAFMKRHGLVLSIMCVATLALAQGAPAPARSAPAQKRTTAAKRVAAPPVSVEAEATKTLPPPTKAFYPNPRDWEKAVSKWVVELLREEARIAQTRSTAAAYKEVMDSAIQIAIQNMEISEERAQMIDKGTATVNDLGDKYGQLLSLAREVVPYTQELQGHYATLKASYDQAYKAYGELLDHARKQEAQLNEAKVRLSMQEAQLNEANARVYRQAQISNAMAIYSLMPRYTPPQTFNLNVNWSDCTKSAAMCAR